MRAFSWAWLLYGLCETLLAIFAPALAARLHGASFGHLAAPTLLVLAFYPSAGAAVGAVVQRALRMRDARAPSLALLASASVVLALFAGLAVRGDLGKSGAVLAVAFAALFALAAVDARADGRRGHWALATPWVAVPLMVAVAWLLRVVFLEASLLRRLGACAAVAGAVFGAAWFARTAIARAWREERRGLRGALAATAALGLACAALLHETPPALPAIPAPDAAAAGRPSVLLVVLDTVRADHLGLYGYERATSPHLDAFAREATVYEQMTTPGDITLTSHASLFTGQFVSRHGVTTTQPVLAASEVTLAERLASAGYANFGIAANCGWIGLGHGIEQGFAYWDPRCGRAFFAGVPPVFLRQLLLQRLRRAAFREQASWRWRSAGEISNEALRALGRLDASHAPFLLFLNYMDVHRPIQPPRAYRERFPGYDRSFDMSSDWSALHTDVNRGKRVVTPRERAHLESQYDGAIAYMDDQLQRVFDELHARGRWDQTLVIVTADHGEGFGDHGTFGHGHGVYQDVVHAPLLVKLPGQHTTRRVATPVSLVDVLPTVLAAVGLPPQPGVDGISLLGEIPEDRALFAESFDEKGEIARALRRGDLKLLRHRGRATALYDIARDPDEAHDIAPQAAAETAARATELASWVKSQASHGAGAALTPAEAERLKALGYLR